MSDEIQGKRVKVQIVVQILETEQGEQFLMASEGELNERDARYMLDKARAQLDDHWRMVAAQMAAQNAPRIAGANGLMPDGLSKALRRGGWHRGG